MNRRSLPWISLAALACGLRVAVVLALWTPEAVEHTYEHGEIAANLVTGRGFTIKFLGVEGPTSQQAPFYPCLLAADYAILGTATSAAILGMQFLQCLAGTAVVLATAWLGHSLLPHDRRYGWVAGGLAAIYPTHLYMVTHIQVAVWATLWLTLAAALAADRRLAGSRIACVALGAILGVLTLTDPILILAAPFLIAMQVRSREDSSSSPGFRSFRGPTIRRIALVAAIAAFVVAPWILRNYVVHREVVFVKSTFGYAFWQGNNPVSLGTDKVPKPSAETTRLAHDGTLAGQAAALANARRETLYIDDVLLKPHGYVRFAGLSEPQRSRLLGGEAVAFVRDNPGRYAWLCLNRLRYFLLFDETNPKAAHPLYRAATIAWLILAVAGAVLLRGQVRTLWPTYAIFGAVALFHVLTIVSARFRIPLESLTWVWAAGFPVAALDRVGLPFASRWKRGAKSGGLPWMIQSADAPP